jgi:uncharacterized protein (TIGR02145 family)
LINSKPNAMKKYLLLTFLLLLILQIKAQTIRDIDNNSYNTTTIGSQEWLKENLKTTRYNDGQAIPNITSPTQWIALTTAGYCWNSNDEITYKSTYGALYNWYAVHSDKLCPSSWHIPTDGELTTLVSYLGGTNIAGGKLKEAGTIHWTGINGSTEPANAGADNSSNFTGLPGGFRDPDDAGNFHKCGIDAHWWASNEYNGAKAFSMSLAVYALNASVHANFKKEYGLSVRCLKDMNTSIHNSKLSNAIIIYPNPANDILFIKKVKSTTSYIGLFDCQGRLLMDVQSGSDAIDISGLSKGIYLVKITDSGNTMIHKLIKK